MKKIAIYGKGGIGKSTVTGNLAVAFAQTGYRVLQIGCDPKADSTMNIVGEQGIEHAMDVLRGGNIYPALEDICKVGFAGVYCVEAGGPIPGMGCAGRGIITTFELLEELEAFEKLIRTLYYLMFWVMLFVEDLQHRLEIITQMR